MENYQRIFAFTDLERNTGHMVTIEGVEVLACNTCGEFYTLINKFTHQASSLKGGRIRNCFLSCPLHGARVDLRDGSTKGQLTTVPLQTFPTRVVDDFVEVAVS